AGTRRLTRPEAVARERRQRRPRSLLALGRRAQPLSRRVGARPPLRRGALVHRRGARAPAGALRADGAELQLLPPARTPVLGGREARGIPRLPATQAEALEALAADPVLTSALGPVLAETYLAVRRSEWATYSEEDEAFEQRGHFEKY